MTADYLKLGLNTGNEIPCIIRQVYIWIRVSEIVSEKITQLTQMYEVFALCLHLYMLPLKCEIRYFMKYLVISYINGIKQLKCVMRDHSTLQLVTS
jgi:hypothetical protein